MNESEPILSKKEVKTALSIKSDNKDDQIDTWIPLVENFVKGYCNIEEIPEEYKGNMIKMIEYNLVNKAGVSSESLSRYSVSYLNDYPVSVLKGLRRRLRW